MDSWLSSSLSYVKSTVNAVSDEIKQTALSLSEDAAGLTFVTKRILAIRGMPFDDSQRVGGATIANPVPQAGGAASSASNAGSSCITVKQLSTFLHKHYPDRFMLWNLSEKTYDYTALDNQVIEFRFPGYPSAPLNQVFALCNSIHAWLTADENNVAVVHCQTGKGRTICALAWYLAWSGQIATVQNALLHVCGKMGVGPEVIIPTQQRYLDYLSAMLAGKKPSARSVVLERVIMNGIPKLGERLPAAAGAAAGTVGEPEEACRPYLQIFKDGQLLFTSTGRDSTELRWYTARDSCVLFPVGLELEGDILIRVRHLSADKKRISMLRYGFHTGFVAPGNTRFLKPALDGAYNDPRFPRAFWIDMIFRPSGSGSGSEGTEEESSEDLSTEAGQARRARRELQEKFWEQVHSARRKTNPAKAAGELITPTTPQPAAAASSPVPTTPMTPGAGEPAAPAAVQSASASPPPASAVAGSSDGSSASSSLVTPAKAKPSLGSLFSSASSKLSSMSSSWGAWGSSLGAVAAIGTSTADPNAAARAEEATHDGAGVLDLSDPAVAKLHAADQEALRKAKRKAATDAAVQAALQSPHARASPGAPAVAAGSAPRRPAPPAGSDPDSFADLQAYVAGLGSLDSRQTEVDSDEEHGGSSSAAASTSAVSSALHKQDELDLDRAMQQHFSSEEAEDKTKNAAAAATSSPAKPAAEAAASTPTKAAAAAVPVAAPVVAAAPAVTPAPAPAAAPAAAAAALSADAALEAELALLSAGEIDLAGGADGDDEVVLDDADEAALLASLQDEMAGE